MRKKGTGLIVICCLLIAGMGACFYYLSTHDVFQTEETVTITKSTESVASTDTNNAVATYSDLDDFSKDVEEAGNQLEAIGDIEAESDDGNITITLPKDFVGNTTQEQIDEAVANEEGIISATLNSDGSLTYIMTLAKYKETLQGMQQGLEESLQQTIDNPDNPHIVSIAHNEAFSEYTVTCSSDELTISEQMLALQLYVYSGAYFQFLVEPPDNVYLIYINSETGAVIYESNAKELAEKKAQ